MNYSVSIDVPDVSDGVRFYATAFGFAEAARPVPTYAVLTLDDCTIGIMEKAEGSSPAKDTDDVRRYDRHWTPVHVDFHVTDFERTLQKALQAGATCEETFKGGTRPPVAFCSDPFGNGFCIIGQRPEAS